MHAARARYRRGQVLIAALRGRALVAVVVVCSLVMLAMGFRYAGESDERWLDDAAGDAARDWFPSIRQPFYFVIGLVDPLPFALLIVVLAGLCLALRRPRLGLLAVVGPVLTGVAVTVLKPMFGRTEDGGEPVYPSGHMAAATALALIAGLLIVSVVGLRPWLEATVVAATTTLVGAGMAFAMTVTGYHYLTDAIGGFCLGVAVVLACASAVGRLPVPGLGRADAASAGGGLPKNQV
jgi:undecaprenyl-diphosphatase